MTSKRAIIPWQKCKCCEDYTCAVHGKHAFECACPAIDVWVECIGKLPYEKCTTEEIDKVVLAGSLLTD